MSIDDLPPLRDVIAAHELRAEKKLGQNFLLDQNITDKIAKLAGDLSEINVIEIGPGPGGLTRSLLRAGAKSVTAVEFDERAVRALQDLKGASAGRLQIIQGDALEADLKALVEGPRMIVANLPYNIATPLLVRWLRELREDVDSYAGMVLMFQKEVAQRITAKVGDKHYGRLAVLCAWLTKARIVYDLPPSAFVPAPKVKSSVVQFMPKAQEAGWPEFEAVEQVTAAGFGQRRKMIRSSLRDYVGAIEALGLDETVRAENLPPEDYLRLARS